MVIFIEEIDSSALIDTSFLQWVWNFPSNAWQITSDFLFFMLISLAFISGHFINGFGHFFMDQFSWNNRDYVELENSSISILFAWLQPKVEFIIHTVFKHISIDRRLDSIAENLKSFPDEKATELCQYFILSEICYTFFEYCKIEFCHRVPGPVFVPTLRNFPFAQYQQHLNHPVFSCRRTM